MPNLINHPEPTVGLVIGTFAAVPYIHLQLESRRRYHPGLPVLVCDDSSSHGPELAGLCRYYEADFRTGPGRLAHSLGDLAAVARGFVWAREQGIEIMVKLSRRFLPLIPWTASLQSLAFAAQHTTYGGACGHFGFALRTEATAYHVPSWIGAGGLTRITQALEAEEAVLVEDFLHEQALQVSRQFVSPADGAETPGQVDAFRFWPWLGASRLERRPEFLWHDRDSPVDYARIARIWELPYQTEDFADPNMGEGDGGNPPPDETDPLGRDALWEPETVEVTGETV